MSLHKSIQSGKEHREPYRRSKAVDGSCRNHGTCAYCRNNRTVKARKMAIQADHWLIDRDWII